MITPAIILINGDSEGKLAEILYSWKSNDGSKVEHKYEFSYDAGKLSYVALYDVATGGSGAMETMGIMNIQTKEPWTES
jgi:hypothetical protein